jgi:hypothetical protein
MCLAVAVRPLRVEELAELLAFDFQASSSGGIPTLKEDWRWDDEEEAVLSTCSSLITIVRNGRFPGGAILALLGERIPHVASSRQVTWRCVTFSY